MTTRTFAPWVAPIAEQLRESRARVLGFARSLPAEAWSRPSTLERWTYKDILAHLGGGNDQMLQKILRAVSAGEQVDPATFSVNTDTENAQGVEERRGRTVQELIAELEADGEEIQELLAGLTEEHKDLPQEGAPISLAQFLAIVRAEDHDGEHLAQLRTALEVRS